jgi:hypothetical protein
VIERELHRADPAVADLVRWVPMGQPVELDV